MAQEKIGQITGSPKRSVARWVEQFESGRSSDFAEFVGANLDSLKLCRLHAVLENFLTESTIGGVPWDTPV